MHLKIFHLHEQQLVFGSHSQVFLVNKVRKLAGLNQNTAFFLSCSGLGGSDFTKYCQMCGELSELTNLHVDSTAV